MQDVHVLVVDDSPLVASTLAELLRIDGYAVSVALDGLTAMAMVEAQVPHCVLLDVDMPGLDGAELTRRLRDKHGDDIVLIAISGGPADDPLVRATFALVDHYLSKPVSSSQLRTLLPSLI